MGYVAMACLCGLPSAVGALIAGDVKSAEGRRRTVHQPGMLVLSTGPTQALKNVDPTTATCVALAYHVDYWNYLGWADTLAPGTTPTANMPMRACWPQRRLHAAGGHQRPRPRQRRRSSGQIRGKSMVADTDRASGHVGGSDRHAPRRRERYPRRPRRDGKANVVVAYFNDPQSVDIQERRDRGRRISCWRRNRHGNGDRRATGRQGVFVHPRASCIRRARGMRHPPAADERRTQVPFHKATVITPTLPQTANRN